MYRYILIYLGVCCFALAAQGPREVAENAFATLDAGDAKGFVSLAHPELMKRLRSARVFKVREGVSTEFPLIGSDLHVVSAFFGALEAVAPNRLRPKLRYIGSDVDGELAVVRFEAEYPKGFPAGRNRFPERIVLKRSGEEWRFLWSGSIQLQVDLEWDPTESRSAKLPNKAPEPKP